ncbi:MAG TPA: SDR family oxidoreductase [Anaerolineae bacterium]|nr:SDR family oxidoreductase [Anaerolineae bacterium]
MIEINLTGRKALVTGGSRGIGAGIVQILAQCNALVSFTYKQNVQAANQLCQEFQGKAQVLAFCTPAENIDAMRATVKKAAQAMGGLDILVHNVGALWPAQLQELELKEWNRGIEMNLTTAFIALKAAYPYLRKVPRGDIVLISSSAVIDGGGGSAFYAAAKAGVEGMMKALMRELPQKNIHINTIHPCVVDTDLFRVRYDTHEKRAKVSKQVPLGRLGKPEDIGYLVAFLCSQMGGFICGQSILVDGGRTMWRKT